MTRGFLGGMLLGAVVCVAAAVGISAVIGPPVPPKPEAAAIEVPPGSEFQERREDRAANVPAPLPQPEPEAAPTVAPPAPDTLDPMARADTQPAAQPETGTPEDRLAAPPEQGQRGRVEVATDVPVLPSPQAALPVAPEAEEGVATPQAPEPPAVSDAQPETDAPATETVSDESPAPDIDPAAPVETAEAPDAVAEAPGEDTARADAPPEAPADEAPAQPETAQTEAPVKPAPTQEDTAQQDGRPTIGTPAQSLIARDNSGGTRLEMQGEAAQADAADAAPEPTAEAEAGDQPPILANAATFDNPEAKPLMAIVLIDDGAFSSAVEALGSFPYPLSFAIDPARDGAAEATRKYREAGFEVLALTDIPETAAAADVEVNMAALLAEMPQAVGVMEGTGSGLQSSRAISDQVTAYLRDSGHGLVMYPNGLDTARKLAEREGVPAATLFRDFDAKGQDASVIRRFLDQAAFKASQEEGGVVMVGRARPETVSALILWGLADRASRVALAPVSAVLRARVGMPAETGAGQ